MMRVPPAVQPGSQGRRLEVFLQVDESERRPGHGPRQPLDRAHPLPFLPRVFPPVPGPSNGEYDGKVHEPGESRGGGELFGTQVIGAQLEQIDPGAILRGQPKVGGDRVGGTDEADRRPVH